MSITKTLCAAAAAVALVTSFTVSAANAQDRTWRPGQFERHEGPHAFGPRCHQRVSAHGDGFAGFSSFRARREAIRHWEREVSRTFGPQFASFSRARDKTVNCDTRGPRLHCTATGNPCR